MTKVEVNDKLCCPECKSENFIVVKAYTFRNVSTASCACDNCGYEMISRGRAIDG